MTQPPVSETPRPRRAWARGSLRGPHEKGPEDQDEKIPVHGNSEAVRPARHQPSPPATNPLNINVCQFANEGIPFLTDPARFARNTASAPVANPSNHITHALLPSCHHRHDRHCFGGRGHQSLRPEQRRSTGRTCPVPPPARAAPPTVRRPPGRSTATTTALGPADPSPTPIPTEPSPTSGGRSISAPNARHHRHHPLQPHRLLWRPPVQLLGPRRQRCHLCLPPFDSGNRPTPPVRTSVSPASAP